MKKIIATVLAMVMALALCVTAFAATTYNAVDSKGYELKTMSNTAYISGSYNQVNQQMTGMVLMGRSNSPVNQMGSNIGQAMDPNGNQFGQSMKMKAKAGRGGKAAQYGMNEIKVGPV